VGGPRLLVVHGGRELGGEIPIPGYKHALTVVVAAAVAQGARVTLQNVPDMTETRVLKAILDHLGATGSVDRGVWHLDTSTMRNVPVPFRLSGQIHGALYLVPALLARFGEVSFPGAGGDRFGPGRPTSQVVAVLERFVATVVTAGGAIHAKARQLRGCAIDLMEFSTGATSLRGVMASSATKTALILAAAARGKTRLVHPVDRDATWELRDFLRASGATVTVEDGAWCVSPGATGDQFTHRLISDSTEIVTFIACAAFVGGSLRLTGITGDRTRLAIADEVRELEGMGVALEWGPDWLAVGGPVDPRPVSHLVIECNGFSTDAHPLLVVPLLRATGVSRITDHVWTDRFAYVELLTRMGAQIDRDGNTVTVWPTRLRPPAQPLEPTDSRAAAAALVAALGVPGASRIHDHAGHLDRSYEALTSRLAGVGASIEELTSIDVA